MKRAAVAVLVILFGLGSGTVFGQTLRVPFDLSQSEIGIEVTVNGEPLYVLLDTGVDPSVIDLRRAENLHLKIDRNGGGELSGFGNTEPPRPFRQRSRGWLSPGTNSGDLTRSLATWAVSQPNTDGAWTPSLVIASCGTESS